MKKFLTYIFFLIFIFFNQANALTNFKYPEKPIDANLCQNLLDQLNSSHFPYGLEEPFKTNINLLIEDVSEIDGKNLEFSAFFNLYIDWLDPRVGDVLKNLNMYEDTEKPTWLCDYEPGSVWGKERKVFDPVIEFFNRKSKPNFQTGLVDWVEIFSNGSIGTRVRDNAKFKSVEFNFRKFPFDQQILTFELWSEFPSFMISLEPSEPAMSDYKNTLYNFAGEDGINIPGWNLKNVSYETFKYKDPTDNYPYKGFILNLEVERLWGYYVYKIILPIIFIWAISWSVFWVRGSQIDAKVNVTIVCLLALIAYNFIIDEDLPKLAYLTFLDAFILLSYFFTGIATVLCVYSYVRHTKSGKDLTLVDEKAHFYGPLLYFVSLILIGVYFFSVGGIYKGFLAMLGT